MNIMLPVTISPNLWKIITSQISYENGIFAARLHLGRYLFFEELEAIKLFFQED